MGSKVDAYSIEAFSNSPQHCVLSSYNIAGRSDGTYIDTQAGEMIINTEVPIEINESKISVVVGSQVITSNTFKFEIFDCGSTMTFKMDNKIQMDSTT